MSRFVGIDYGRARIGIAVSDENKKMALPFLTIKAGKTLESSSQIVVKALEKYTVDIFILGLPLLLSGKDSPMTEEVRLFAKALEEASHKKVILLDERLSSKMADRMLETGGLNRKERAKHVDSLAATLILETYLSQRSD